MIRRSGGLAGLLLAVLCIVAVSGCAGTRASGSDELPTSPDLLRKEIVEIENDILNAEEMYKAKLTELQMEEDAGLRTEVNRLWIELEHLRSRKTALEERLAEIERGGDS